MLTKLDLNHFLKAFRSVLTEDDLNEALRRVTNMLGFSQFAMGHHVDLTCPPQGAIRLSTYNEDWVSHVLERAYFAEDPIHLASTKTVNGFSWHDVGDSTHH